MNYLEAIKSGKPYRRKEWVSLKWHPSFDLGNNMLTTISMPLEDLIADDWEVKKEPQEWWAINTGEGYYRLYDSQPSMMSNTWKMFKVREVLE